MQRRDFLRNSALASGALMIPNFLKAYQPKRLYNSRSENILVVIQLSGGNDGLNTIIPYRNGVYYKKRPTLAIKAEEVLKVSDDLGFNPSLAALQNLYDNGEMTVINSVGYPNPDRSHFRSMDIWHTASGSEDYWSTGWLGRFLDSNCSTCEVPHYMLELDESLSLAMKGAQRSGFAAENMSRLKKITQNRFLKSVANSHTHEGEDQVAYLYKTMIETQQSANYLHEKSKVYTSEMEYPQGDFGRDLKQVAELITADTDTRIYYISLSGFDTHAFQKNPQNRLLKQYADGINAFVQDLKKNRLFNDVTILTFSEFGRRVKQNASGGTDHGTANNVFIMNGKLKKAGFYNASPNLVDLDNGDLKYEIDFRRVYASLLEDCLNSDAQTVLQGSFDKLRLF
ncbi:MAG: DUF1501 domain-containing protein [Bacteroidota bacterium]